MLDITKNTMTSIMEFTIQTRQLNLTTLINLDNVKRFDGNVTNNNWCFRYFLPIIKHFSRSFYDFLEKLLKISPNYRFSFCSIGAFKLMFFHNTVNKLDVF